MSNDILAKYSTPGLRRNMMDRTTKRDHLDRLGIRGKRADEILDELYGPEVRNERPDKPESQPADIHPVHPPTAGGAGELAGTGSITGGSSAPEK